MKKIILIFIIIMMMSGCQRTGSIGFNMEFETEQDTLNQK